MSKPHPMLRPAPQTLRKQHSWSPDTHRDEAWLRRRKGNRRDGINRTKSLMDEDLEELKACIELGFGFDSADIDPRLSDTLPALDFYQTVNRHYTCSLTRSSSSSSMVSQNDTESDSPTTMIVDPGDDPEMIKTRLRQWAQVVACSVRGNQSASYLN